MSVIRSLINSNEANNTIQQRAKEKTLTRSRIGDLAEKAAYHDVCRGGGSSRGI